MYQEIDQLFKNPFVYKEAKERRDTYLKLKEMRTQNPTLFDQALSWQIAKLNQFPYSWPEKTKEFISFLEKKFNVQEYSQKGGFYQVVLRYATKVLGSPVIQDIVQKKLRDEFNSYLGKFAETYEK